MDILTPINGLNLNLNEDIFFSAHVSDSEDSPNTLAIEWKSSIDGVLNTDPADANGSTSFISSNLSEGNHQITITVTDSDDLDATDMINITVKKLQMQ